MKIFAGLLLLLGVYFLGHYIGGQAPSIEDDYEEVILDEGELVPLEKKLNSEVAQGTRAQNKKKERLDYKKELVNYIDRVPFHFLATQYFERRDKLDNLAFSGELDKGKWNSERRVAVNQRIFEELLPAVKQRKPFLAEGSFKYKGFEIPYQLVVSYMSYFHEEEKTEIPTEWGKLESFVKFKLDASQFNTPDKEYKVEIYGGSGVSDFYVQEGLIFIRLTIYGTSGPEALLDLQDILVGAPGEEGSPTSIRFFNTTTKKWMEVTNSVEWRPISYDKFEKLRDEH